MSSSKDDENVLVCPAEHLFRAGYFSGLSFDSQKYLPVIQAESKYMRRGSAEHDPAYKQIIPYVILRYGDQILRYRRGQQSSEGRLVGNYSIGIGGHVSVTDPTMFAPSWTEAMKREVSEELLVGSDYSISLVCLLNDDSNDVGKVHLGLVHVLRLADRDVRKREKAIAELQFVNANELAAKMEMYENWSQICIHEIERILRASENPVKIEQ